MTPRVAKQQITRFGEREREVRGGESSSKNKIARATVFETVAKNKCSRVCWFRILCTTPSSLHPHAYSPHTYTQGNECYLRRHGTLCRSTGLALAPLAPGARGVHETNRNVGLDSFSNPFLFFSPRTQGDVELDAATQELMLALVAVAVTTVVTFGVRRWVSCHRADYFAGRRKNLHTTNNSAGVFTRGYCRAEVMGSWM